MGGRSDGKPPNGPETPEKRFGRELRRVRKEAGLSQTRVGRACGCSASLVSSVERATRVPQPDFARGLDRLFGLNQFFTRLARGIGEPLTSGPEWYARWIDEFEPGAHTLRSWDPLLIPGLLQTDDYARAVIAGDLTRPRDVADRVAARKTRQLILDRDDPPEVWVLIDEGVIRRLIGTPAIMAAQLDRLLELAGRPNITIQVVPFGATTTAGMMSGFIIAELDGGQTAVSIESAGEGMVSVNAEHVSAVSRRYDRLRAEAHRPDDSLRLIEEARGRWRQ
ncbi:hypothetical protein C1I98_18910 [Spongiactinospora gelatinilytica]|uniref:HTH cro/C1-type domain-containing protein n=1 Tax=Spongiactinospora gelatinilytica TaxID=2666298 RepID=A0A2W2HWU6_9ACTN|nr:helix-turn-helix transcriptional regulator [Spongiactinospora gelatinilytica]PZG43084.1 hypothetical protein C1I98_18910 [Spongiactinospora gelatinilytica]